MSSVIRTVNLWIVGCPLTFQEDVRSLKGLRGFELVKKLSFFWSIVALFVTNFLFLFFCSLAYSVKPFALTSNYMMVYQFLQWYACNFS